MIEEEKQRYLREWEKIIKDIKIQTEKEKIQRIKHKNIISEYYKKIGDVKWN